MDVDPRWVLALFLKAEPAPTPWRDTYENSAEVIARVASRNPVFAGEQGAYKTAALLVSIGQFESSLKPDAEGDCDKTDPKTKMCVRGSRPHSFCMFQIHESNFKSLGVTREELMNDFDRCASTAVKLIRSSFTICRARPTEERLAWYAAGGTVCSTRGVRESKHRIAKGQWLFNAVPFSVEEDEHDSL